LWVISDSQRRRGDKFNKDKYTLETVLDQPYRFHNTLGRPATHTTHQCSFISDLE
jgi:hypothetical protein